MKILNLLKRIPNNVIGIINIRTLDIKSHLKTMSNVRPPGSYFVDDPFAYKSE